MRTAPAQTRHGPGHDVSKNKAARGRGGALVLGIDTATPPSTLALVRGEQIVVAVSGPFGRGTDAWILGAIDTMLELQQAHLGDLDAIAVSAGPGTFTGLRVALATAAGLAWGSGVPATGIGTLDALIESALAATGRTVKAPLLACVDARRGEVYAAASRPDPYPSAPLDLLWGPALMSPDELVEALSGAQRADAIGSGLELDPRFGELTKAVVDPPPLAASLARLAARTLERNGAAALPPAIPSYVRPHGARPGRNPLRR